MTKGEAPCVSPIPTSLPCVYEGALVRLRASEPGDAESFYEWFNDAEAARGLGVRYPVTRQAEHDRVAAHAAPSYDDAHFAVETLDGRLLGACGLYKASPERRSADLGVALVDRTQWNKGYGTDTVRTLCRFGFAEMGLHRIELKVFAFLPAARRVYEKAGFTAETVARQAYWDGGRWHDDVVMGLLEGELQ